MSNLTRYRNGAPIGAVMVKMECEVANLSDAINLQLAIQRRAKRIIVLEVTPKMEIDGETIEGERPAKARRRRGRTARILKKTKLMDKRAVWRIDRRQNRKVLNTSETLKKLGLSSGQLMAMTTKMGTLEHSLKCTIRSRKTVTKK
jgi:hypothetical protein